MLLMNSCKPTSKLLQILFFFAVILMISGCMADLPNPNSIIKNAMHSHLHNSEDKYKFSNIEEVKSFLKEHNVQYPTGSTLGTPTLEELQLLAYNYINDKKSYIEKEHEKMQKTVASKLSEASSVVDENVQKVQKDSRNFWNDLKDTALYYVPFSGYGNSKIDIGFKKWYFDGWSDYKINAYLAKHKLDHLVKKGMSRDRLMNIVEQNWDSILQNAKKQSFKTTGDYFDWLVNDFGWSKLEMQTWLKKQGKNTVGLDENDLRKLVSSKYDELNEKQEEVTEWFNSLSTEDLVSWLKHQYVKVNDYSKSNINEIRQLAVDTYNKKAKGQDAMTTLKLSLNGDYYFSNWSLEELRNWMMGKGEDVEEEYECLKARAKEKFDDLYRNVIYKIEDFRIENKPDEGRIAKMFDKTCNWLRYVNPMYYWV